MLILGLHLALQRTKNFFTQKSQLGIHFQISLPLDAIQKAIYCLVNGNVSLVLSLCSSGGFVSLLVNSYDRRHALWMTFDVVENAQKDNKAEQGGNLACKAQNISQSILIYFTLLILLRLSHSKFIVFRVYNNHRACCPVIEPSWEIQRKKCIKWDV